MNLRQVVKEAVRHRPRVKRALVEAEARLAAIKASAAGNLPLLQRTRTTKLTVAITADCNLRCVGCRYGRDFMTGSRLELDTVRRLLDDAAEAGIEVVRLYGGEPLLHPDLPAMVSHAVGLGLSTYVTTNGVLLERRVDELHAAGLRSLTLGFYGTGEAYDDYVQRRDRFEQVRSGIAAVRERHGEDFALQLNYLIMRPTCTVEALHEAWAFAERYDMSVHTDLIHYSLPYFSEGPDGALQFRPEDRPAIEAVTAELLRLKQAHPERIPESARSLRSIPDWLMKGPDMRVPCTAGDLMWVGADGSVKLCYVTFDLGNLHQTRLRDLLYTAEHRAAQRGAFELNCPNCHCERDRRITRDLGSRRRYGD